MPPAAFTIGEARFGIVSSYLPEDRQMQPSEMLEAEFRANFLEAERQVNLIANQPKSLSVLRVVDFSHQRMADELCGNSRVAEKVLLEGENT